jgi:predicted metal-dependent peptidase
VIDTNEAEAKISLARTIVRSKGPYYSKAMASLVFIPVQGIQTMCVTTNLILGYDPEWALMAPATVLAADVVHEINHFIRRHLHRIPGGDPHLKNIAGDLSINPDLLIGGWDLADKTSPRPVILPKDYNFPDGLSMEEYYALLMKEQEKKNSKLQELLDALRDGGDGKGGGVGSGACGGIAQGAASSAVEKALEAIPGVGRSKAEVKNVEVIAAKQIKDYVAQKGRGSVPEKLIRDAELSKEISRIRWQDILSRVIRTATGQVMLGGEVEPSYIRLSRRMQPETGIIRPSYITQMPEIAIVRDTSGSMGPKQLQDCVRESYAIVKSLGIDEVWFTDADAAVSMPWQRVKKEFFDKLSTSCGGGGTHFAPAIKDALKLHPKPDLLIYCTDGDGSAGDPPRGMGVVFAVVPSYHNKAPCEWATTVFIENPEKSTS